MDHKREPTRELVIAAPTAGLPMLLFGLVLLLGASTTSFILACRPQSDSVAFFVIAGVLSILVGVLVLFGLTIVYPNQAKVVLLFGRYVGTIRRDGFYWVNPFTLRKRISLRAHNFNSQTLKVNDQLGNPIEIGAVVVWQVANTAHAMFDVEDYGSYVQVQSEAAVRNLAAKHPYDTHEGHMATSLRGSLEEVNAELQTELGERLALAGIDVLEARLSHLAYAPEIASAMLRRQQAEAVIAARSRIVEGAVSMVQMALDHLREKSVIELDEERKAAMVSNLLVVLCSEHDATPVINTGTLHN
jgi:regulator of protease activity HflC (stomatin/prohibitin superfamily)